MLTTEFPLGLKGVGVPIAALAYVCSRQLDGHSQLGEVTFGAAQLQFRSRNDQLPAVSWSELHTVRDTWKRFDRIDESKSCNGKGICQAWKMPADLTSLHLTI